jgi:hypothetical protein
MWRRRRFTLFSPFLSKYISKYYFTRRSTRVQANILCAPPTGTIRRASGRAGSGGAD